MTQTAFCTPTGIASGLLAHTRSDWTDFVKNGWKLWHDYAINDGSGSPGWVTEGPNNGPDLADDDPFPQIRIHDPGEAWARLRSPWFVSYQLLGQSNIIDLGMADANMLAIYDRLSSHMVELLENVAITDPTEMFGLYGNQSNSGYILDGAPWEVDTWAKYYVINLPSGVFSNYGAYHWGVLNLIKRSGRYSNGSRLDDAINTAATEADGHSWVTVTDGVVDLQSGENAFWMEHNFADV